MEPAADVGWKELDQIELSRISGPQRLVRLFAAEHVEFGGAFFDRGPDRETQHHRADAVRPERRAETVLAQVEPVVQVETVGHRGNVVVQTKREHAQPSGLERSRRDVVMERLQRRCLERRRTDSPRPLPFVEPNQRVECFLPLRGGCDAHEINRELVAKGVQMAAAATPLGGTQRVDVTLPRVSLKCRKWTDSRYLRLPAPIRLREPLAQPSGQPVRPQMIEEKGLLSRTKPGFERIDAGLLEAAACDEVEIIRSGAPRAQKLQLGQPRQSTA